MIRCVLVDDEADSLEVMEMLLKTYCPQVKVEAVCNTAEKGIAAINQFRPDVVFLDIEMPNMNGFDMLEKFDELFFDVVFITAYHQFAIKAFRYSALNYLLKPVDPDDLVETIQRIEKEIISAKRTNGIAHANCTQWRKPNHSPYCTYHFRRFVICKHC